MRQEWLQNGCQGPRRNSTRITLSPDGRRSPQQTVSDPDPDAGLGYSVSWSMGFGASVTLVLARRQGMATGDARGSVRLYDAGTGQPIIELKEHTDSVEFLLFSPDGTELATASPADSRVVVWHSSGRRPSWPLCRNYYKIQPPQGNRCSTGVGICPSSRTRVCEHSGWRGLRKQGPGERFDHACARSRAKTAASRTIPIASAPSIAELH